MAQVRVTDGVVLSHPRCGHGLVELVQFEDGALVGQPRRQELPSRGEGRSVILDSFRREAERLADGASWIEAWLPPCVACQRAGNGKRQLRPNEQVSRHAPSGALPLGPMLHDRPKPAAPAEWFGQE